MRTQAAKASAEKSQQPKTAAQKNNPKQSLLFNSKFVMSMQEKKIKANKADKQRYQFSPSRQDVNLQKNAWERLLERSFDPRSANLIRQQKAILDKKKLDQQNAYSNFHSPRELSQASLDQFDKAEYFSPQNKRSFGGGVLAGREESEYSVAVSIQKPTSLLSRDGGGTRSENTSVWKAFIDKTADDKVQKTDANYSTRRAMENFISGRTLNPSQYQQQAEVLLLPTEIAQEKALRQGNEVTGCSKRTNPLHNTSNIKYTYNKDEIESQSTTPLRKQFRERSNNSHFSGDVLVPNENTKSYIGSSKMNCLIVDKVLTEDKNGGGKSNKSRVRKNQMDYKSSIPCLSEETERSGSENRKQVKYLKHMMSTLELSKENQQYQTAESGREPKRLTHMLSSFQLGAERETTAESQHKLKKKAIQMPYQSRPLHHQLQTAGEEWRKPAGKVKKERDTTDRSKSSRPDGIRNMFQSQIGSFS